MSELTPEDKRQLAEMLVPHLAWDLARAEVWTFNPAIMSAMATEVMLHHIDAAIRSKAMGNQGFRVVIIPTTGERLNPAR